jgi:hypothetical protein
MPTRKIPITRIWAMPNSRTFSIKPIRNLIDKYTKGLSTIVDPFANGSTIGTITNDLNPEYDTDYHMDALQFLKTLGDETADAVLYDPPYNVAQATLCYKSFGKEKLETHVSNALYWSKVRQEVSRVLKKGGVCLSFGWSTVGIGKKNNMRIVEILDVCHGGSHYDTLCTVEVKI